MAANIKKSVTCFLYGNKGEAYALLFFFIGSFALRWFFAAREASSWDEVDFVLALDRYDILQMQPHFPGYPLYIVFGMLLKKAVIDPVLSLSLLSAIFGSFTLLVFFLFVKRIACLLRMEGGGWWAWVCTLLFSLHPALLLAHLQPMSDAFGLFMAILLLWVVSLGLDGGCARTAMNPYFIALQGAAIYGMMLGVRLSYFPFAFVLLLPMWKMGKKCADRPVMPVVWVQWCTVLLTGLAFVCLWLIPTANTEGGLADYWALGKQFTAGHFQQWGGTVWNDSSSGMLVSLISWIVQQWIGIGLTGSHMREAALPVKLTAYIMLGTLFALAAARVRHIWIYRNRETGGSVPKKDRKPDVGAVNVLALLCLAVIPYLLWNMAGQNVVKWRHLLPLFPFLLMIVARLLLNAWNHKIKLLRMVALLYCVGLGLQAAFMLYDFTQPQPVNKMANDVRNSYFRGNSLIYTWEEKRIIDYYAPEIRTIRLKTYDVFVQSVKEQAQQYDHLLVTSAVVNGFLAQGEGAALLPHLQARGRWSGNALIDPVYYDIILYELEKDMLFIK